MTVAVTIDSQAMPSILAMFSVFRPNGQSQKGLKVPIAEHQHYKRLMEPRV